MEPFRGKASGKRMGDRYLEGLVSKDKRIAELEAEVESLKSFIRRIADTPEREATAERLFLKLEEGQR